METLKVREIARGKMPQTNVGVYVWRDGDVVFYVGQSCAMSDRLLSYLGLGSMARWGEGTLLNTLLSDNLPASKDWRERQRVANAGAKWD